MTSKNAWIAGATGLVGSHLLDELLAPHSPFQNVVSLGRKEPQRKDLRLTNAFVDFARLEAMAPQGPCHSAFCSLGTTIKKAGSRNSFRAVDYDAVLAFARLAQSRGAEAFYLVSSVGANPRSPVFYSRVKGEVEEALKTMGFKSLAIARPSFLVGDRQEHRPGEKLALKVLKYIPVMRTTNASDVAQTLVQLAAEPRPGVWVLEPRDLSPRRTG